MQPPRKPRSDSNRAKLWHNPNGPGIPEQQVMVTGTIESTEYGDLFRTVLSPLTKVATSTINVQVVIESRVSEDLSRRVRLQLTEAAGQLGLVLRFIDLDDDAVR